MFQPPCPWLKRVALASFNDGSTLARPVLSFLSPNSILLFCLFSCLFSGVFFVWFFSLFKYYCSCVFLFPFACFLAFCSLFPLFSSFVLPSFSCLLLNKNMEGQLCDFVVEPACATTIEAHVFLIINWDVSWCSAHEMYFPYASTTLRISQSCQVSGGLPSNTSTL